MNIKKITEAKENEKNKAIRRHMEQFKYFVTNFAHKQFKRKKKETKLQRTRACD